jgi:hypothetical protein
MKYISIISFLVFGCSVAATAQTNAVPQSPALLPNNSAVLIGNATTVDVEGIEVTEFSCTCITPSGDTLQIPNSIATGERFKFLVPVTGSNCRIIPKNNQDPRNGVTTYDLLLIQRHILDLEPLNSPYKMIAADVSWNQIISVFDITEIRHLILGIYPEFPNCDSWEFIDKTYIFPNIFNPFVPMPPIGYIDVLNVQDTVENLQFIGIKMGDINLSAQANGLDTLTGSDIDDRSAAYLQIQNRSFEAGEVFDVPVTLSEAALGCQATIVVDRDLLELVEVLPADDQHVVAADRVSVAWLSSLDVEMSDPTLTPVRTLRVRAKQRGQLQDAVRLSATEGLRPEVYPLAYPVPHRLGLEFKTTQHQQISAAMAVPNPTTGGFSVQLSADAGSHFNAQINVHDATGRLVHTAQQALTGSQQLLEVPANAIAVPGVYFWQVNTLGGFVQNGKIVRL